MFGVSWRFHSSLIGGASIQKSDAHYLKKRAALTKKRRPSSFQFSLEKEPQTELHTSRIVGAVELQEAGVVNALVDRIELCMVKGVEHLPFEVEPGLLVDREFFGESKVKVETARQVKRVAPHIAEREACRYRKSSRVVIEHPERSAINRRLLGGRDRRWITHLVRPRPGALAIAYSGVVTIRRIIFYAERVAR